MVVISLDWVLLVWWVLYGCKKEKKVRNIGKYPYKASFESSVIQTALKI